MKCAKCKGDCGPIKLFRGDKRLCPKCFKEEIVVIKAKTTNGTN